MSLGLLPAVFLIVAGVLGALGVDARIAWASVALAGILMVF